MRFRRPSPRPESPLPRARISAASFRRPPLLGHSRRTGIPAGVLGHGTQHRGAYHKFSDTDPRAWSSARNKGVDTRIKSAQDDFGLLPASARPVSLFYRRSATAFQ